MTSLTIDRRIEGVIMIVLVCLIVVLLAISIGVAVWSILEETKL
jgi:hypothetical protein